MQNLVAYQPTPRQNYECNNSCLTAVFQENPSKLVPEYKAPFKLSSITPNFVHGGRTSCSPTTSDRALTGECDIQGSVNHLIEFSILDLTTKSSC